MSLWVHVSFAISTLEQKSVGLLPSSDIAFIALNLKLLQANSHEDLGSNGSIGSVIKRATTIAEQLAARAESKHLATNPIVFVDTFDQYLTEKYHHQFWSESSFDDLDVEKLKHLTQPKSFRGTTPEIQRKISLHEARREKVVENRITSILQKTQFVIDENIKKSFASDEMVLLRKVLLLYYRHLPADQLSGIVFEIAKLPVHASAMEVATVCILNSGPQLQKLLQLIARNDAVTESLKTLFSKLESQGKDVPWPVVQRALIAQGFNLQMFDYFEREPLGIGTMAQTHRAQYTDQNNQRRSVVVRLLKPGIEALVMMDHMIMTKVAEALDQDPTITRFGLPKMARLVQDVHDSILEELDVQRTIRNQMEARKIYHRSLLISFDSQKNFVEINVPSAFRPGLTTTVMIQDLVFGSKPTKEFKKLAELYPTLYTKVAEQLADVWLEETFFKSGFFHADLHQGNLLALYTDEAIRVQILDFGMVGKLTPKLQNSALLFALGIDLQRPDLMARSLSGLTKLPLTLQKQKELEKKIQARLVDIQKELGSPGRSSSSTKLDPNSVEGWTTWALNEDLDLNFEFLKLNRGVQALQSLLKDSKSKLSIRDIAAKVAFRHKIKTAQLVVSESGLKAKEYPRLILKTVAPSRKAIQCSELF